MAFDQSQATTAIAIPTTTICQKSPARRSWLSEMRNRLRRAGSGVDAVTAQDPSRSRDLRPCAQQRVSYVAQESPLCNICFMIQPQPQSSPLSELCSALPSLPMRLREVGRFVAANDYDATTRSMRDLAAAAGAKLSVLGPNQGAAPGSEFRRHAGGRQARSRGGRPCPHFDGQRGKG